MAISRAHNGHRNTRGITNRSFPLLSLGLLLGYHVSVSVSMFGGTVPNIIGLPFALAAIVVHYRRVSPIFVGAASAMTLFLFVSVSWGVLVRGAPPSLFETFALWLYTAAYAAAGYLAITASDPSAVRGWCALLSSALIVGAGVEVATPLKELVWIFWENFDIFVNTAASLGRDESVFGGYRPRLFASEPAHLAATIMLLQTGWIVLTRRLTPKSMAMICLWVLAALLLIRSPISVLPLLFLSARMVFGLQRSQAGGNFAEMALRMSFLMLVGTGLLVLTGWVLSFVFATRLEAISERNDWSTIVRTYGSIVAGWRTAMESPLFGSGIGNLDPLYATVQQVYLSFGVPPSVVFSSVIDQVISGNALATILMFFGFVGGIVYLLLWQILFKALAPRASPYITWALFFMISSTTGAIYSPIFLYPILLLLSVVGMATASTTRRAQ